MSAELLTVMAVLAGVFVVRAGRIYFRARKARLVRCPGTGTGATIELDAVRAALLLAPPEQHTVKSCSLWPERAYCAQQCCDELSLTSGATCFQELLAKWYVGKSCAVCHVAIPPVARGEFTPALLSPAGRLVEWSEVTATTIFGLLETHRPICARCDVAERFRQKTPHLVRSSDDDVEAPPHRTDG